MDFAQRSSTPASAGASASTHAPGPNSKKSKKMFGIIRWLSFVMLTSLTVLVVALIGSLAFSRIHNEARYVNSSDYQAVFLNGGQVYFGKIGALNDKYLTLNDIYYLKVNQSVQPGQTATTPSDVSLVKLGCELHGPQDQMIINSSEVTFWENLKSNGQVGQAIAAYQKQNPNGQDCSATAAAATKK